MSAPAVLIASAKLRPGEDQAFSAWQARHNIVIGKFPGFISSDVIPPSRPESNEWTIVLNFRSQDELTAWQRSSERAKIVGEAVPLFEGGRLGEVAQSDRPGEPPGSQAECRLEPSRAQRPHLRAIPASALRNSRHTRHSGAVWRF